MEEAYIMCDLTSVWTVMLRAYCKVYRVKKQLHET